MSLHNLLEMVNYPEPYQYWCCLTSRLQLKFEPQSCKGQEVQLATYPFVMIKVVWKYGLN